MMKRKKMNQIKTFIQHLLLLLLFILFSPIIFVVVSIMLVIDCACMEKWNKYNISDTGRIILSILALPVIWIAVLFTAINRIIYE